MPPGSIVAPPQIQSRSFEQCLNMNGGNKCCLNIFVGGFKGSSIASFCGFRAPCFQRAAYMKAPATGFLLRQALRFDDGPDVKRDCKMKIMAQWDGSNLVPVVKTSCVRWFMRSHHPSLAAGLQIMMLARPVSACGSDSEFAYGQHQPTAYQSSRECFPKSVRYPASISIT